MNIQLYENYVKNIELGIKTKAKELLKQFIESFCGNIDEMRQWVWSYLAEYEESRYSSMRHEIFVHMIFPVLLEGYREKDFESTMWLGILMRELVQARSLHEKIDLRSDFSLLEECYKRDSENSKVIDILLHRLVKRLEYCEHEWPSGILNFNAGATLEQCEELRYQKELAVELDKDLKHTEFLRRFGVELDLYESKIRKYQASRK